MDIRGTVQAFIPAMDSSEKVYELFHLLGYSGGKLLDPTYKRNTRNLLEIEKAKDIVKTEAYRVFPVKQESLLEEGWEYPENVDAIHDLPKDAKTIQALPKSIGAVHELPLQKLKQKSLIKDKSLTGKYAGNKWGGKYLRAPDISLLFLEKAKGIW